MLKLTEKKDYKSLKEQLWVILNLLELGERYPAWDALLWGRRHSLDILFVWVLRLEGIEILCRIFMSEIDEKEVLDYRGLVGMHIAMVKGFKGDETGFKVLLESVGFPSRVNLAYKEARTLRKNISKQIFKLKHPDEKILETIKRHKEIEKDLKEQKFLK
ncbi:MAG: hypothetical protein PHT54_01310 [Candidatus Nanoarchaeia archaeon]|nr:hypothetical protein [Candidatus Nanoarchaeia archaeon]